MRAKQKPRSSQWIEHMTGKDRQWWVAKVQALITKNSKPTKDPWHGTTNTEKMVQDLMKEIKKTYGHDFQAKTGSRISAMETRRFDENMRMASVLGYVLTLFYARLHRAKAYDPRRPVKLRQVAYQQRHLWSIAMFRAMTDESEDQDHFPGQKWESPFDPYPTDGYFV